MTDTDKIPDKIYQQCLSKTFDRLDRRLLNFNRICKNFEMGLYPYPDINKSETVDYDGYKFNLTKDAEDAFDIVYYISMTVTENRFISPFERCLHDHKIEFNYRKYPDKLELFDDFTERIEQKYGLKAEIIFHRQYLVFRVMIMKFTKTEQLVLEPIQSR